MPTWCEVEKNYGKLRADAMKKSQFLQGITIARCICPVCGKEEWNIPEDDIRNAYKDSRGQKIMPWEWD